MIQKKSSLITNENFYINFNYTGVLENVYGISISNIIHIHDSLRKNMIDPVLGHGNRIASIEFMSKENKLKVYLMKNGQATLKLSVIIEPLLNVHINTVLDLVVIISRCNRDLCYRSFH